MNRLIHSIGEQNLRRIESEKISHFAFHRLALGIACQGFRIQRAQPRQHARRTTDGALVEIETQSLAAGQRRPISVQILYRGAGLKHAAPHSQRFGVSAQAFGFGQRNGRRRDWREFLRGTLAGRQ